MGASLRPAQWARRGESRRGPGSSGTGTGACRSAGPAPSRSDPRAGRLCRTAAAHCLREPQNRPRAQGFRREGLAAFRSLLSRGRKQPAPSHRRRPRHARHNANRRQLPRVPAIGHGDSQRRSAVHEAMAFGRAAHVLPNQSPAPDSHQRCGARSSPGAPSIASPSRSICPMRASCGHARHWRSICVRLSSCSSGCVSANPLGRALHALGLEGEDPWRAAARIKVLLPGPHRMEAKTGTAAPAAPPIAPVKVEPVSATHVTTAEDQVAQQKIEAPKEAPRSFFDASLWSDPDVRWLTGVHESEGPQLSRQGTIRGTSLVDAIARAAQAGEPSCRRPPSRRSHRPGDRRRCRSRRSLRLPARQDDRAGEVPRLRPSRPQERLNGKAAYRGRAVAQRSSR